MPTPRSFAAACVDGRRVLGHLVAHVDRPRLVLDAGAPADSGRRTDRRVELGIRRAAHDVLRHRRRARARPSSFWGFRAPLGAWICIWGCGAMLTSAPFDNWWHNAYGLDVRIISPPHTVLALGIFSIVVGALLLTLAQQNRADDAIAAATRVAARRRRRSVHHELRAVPHGVQRAAHDAQRDSSTSGGARVFPFALTAMSRAIKLRWPATRGRGVLHGGDAAADVDPPALSGDAEAGSDLPAHHAHGDAVVPVADRSYRRSSSISSCTVSTASSATLALAPIVGAGVRRRRSWPRSGRSRPSSCHEPTRARLAVQRRELRLLDEPRLRSADATLSTAGPIGRFALHLVARRRRRDA